MIADVETNFSLSANVIAYLRGKGMTLKEIGRLMGLSESFTSRVARGERTFSIDHLLKLERSLSEPLPFLLLQSIPKNSIPQAQRHLYEKALKLLHKSGMIRLDEIERGKDETTAGTSTKLKKNAV